MTDDQLDQEFEKSRTQKKHEADAAQELGERLLTLTDKQLKKLQLDESLLEAVFLAKEIKAYGGKKRQLQYIGKLMRHLDILPIEQFFAEQDDQHKLANAKFKVLENWRDKLIEQGVSVVPELEQEFPGLDAQKLRQLVRNATNKKNEKLALKSKRAIFQYLKELSSIQSL